MAGETVATFSAQGAVKGFNPSRDGSVVFVKILQPFPEHLRGVLKGNVRPGLLDIAIPAQMWDALGGPAAIRVTGKLAMHEIEKEFFQGRERKMGWFLQVRYEVEKAERLETVSAPAAAGGVPAGARR